MLEIELFDTVKNLIQNDLVLEALKIIFTYFDHHRNLYSKAFKVTGQNSFEDILTRHIMSLFTLLFEKHPLNLEGVQSIISSENLADYYSSGFVYIIKNWIINENFSHLPVEAIYESYLYIISHTLLELLET